MNQYDKNKAQRKPSSGTGPAASIKTCARCGTCCKKGGPAFHLQDKMLIENGVIDAKSLYTLREGEYAYDHVKACLSPVTSDVIKIKGRNDSWVCVYFDASENACRIYPHRPAECRALKCWDTRELEKMYAKNRLTRKDLIGEIKGLWDLIEDHHRRCNYEMIKNLVEALSSHQQRAARRKLLEIIHYDTEIRKLVVSQGGLAAEMLDFLFGRPLGKTIAVFGLKIRKDGSKISLEPA